MQFRNPYGVMTTPTMAMYFKESSGATVAQNIAVAGFTTTAGTCTVTTMTRSAAQTTVGLTGAEYTLTFTCSIRLLSTGRLNFVFPDEQVAYFASTTCQDENNNDLSCTKTPGTNSFAVMIEASKYCTTECPSTKVYTMRLINARNPYFINSPLT